MRLFSPCLVLGLVVVLAGQAQAQTIEAGSLRLKLGGRIQYQFNTTSVSEEDLANDGVSVTLPESTFEMRRARFGANLAYEEWLTARLEFEFAMARLQTRDVWINFGIADAFQVRAGQFKKPFSLLQLTSSATYPVIERGARIRGLADALRTADLDNPIGPVLTPFRSGLLIGEEQDLLDQLGYQSYDMGAEVHGEVGRLTYAAGVFNGAGSDRLSETGVKAFAGRATLQLAKTKPLVVGVAASRRAFRPLATSRDTRDGVAFEADLELGAFRRPGVHVLAEVSGGDNLAVDGSTFFGAQGVVSWFQPITHTRVEGWEIAGRASWGDPRDNVEGDAGLLLTPGINLYFSGRNRLMLNWDVFLSESDRFREENALRAQAQIYF